MTLSSHPSQSSTGLALSPTCFDFREKFEDHFRIQGGCPMVSNKLSLCIVVFVITVMGGAVHAQVNAGIIRGIVTDKTGAVVAGAKVRLRNQITNYEQIATTDSQGAYQLIDVPFNNYSMTVETGAGFEPSIREVNVRSNLAQQIDVQLGVAPVRQEVTVSATRDLIEPDKTAPTTVMDRNWILRFPTGLPSRSAEEIVATAPGWTEDANGRLH